MAATDVSVGALMYLHLFGCKLQANPVSRQNFCAGPLPAASRVRADWQTRILDALVDQLLESARFGEHQGDDP